MKTKEQIMTETFEFYSTPSNRAVRLNGGCYYLDDVTGNKCAVGRCLEHNEELSSMETSVESRWSEISKLFLPEYQGHEVDFWQCLQDWHDKQLNFFDDGLSVYGVSSGEKIWNKYSREPLPEILNN